MTKVRSAIIKSVQGESPGPASAISYTVSVGFDTITQDVPGVVPHNERWPDTYDTRAAKVGTAIVCHEFEGGNLQFYIFERVDVTECA